MYALCHVKNQCYYYYYTINKISEEFSRFNCYFVPRERSQEEFLFCLFGFYSKNAFRPRAMQFSTLVLLTHVLVHISGFSTHPHTNSRILWLI